MTRDINLADLVVADHQPSKESPSQDSPSNKTPDEVPSLQEVWRPTEPPAQDYSPKSMPSPATIEAEICKRSMYDFVLRAWHLVEPNTTFVDNWHISTICNYLEACYHGEIHNLVINIPPRYMKSLLVNVFFPAWVWTQSPEKKFMCITYAQDLARRDSLLMRGLITSEWYKERFAVKLARDQNQTMYYKNTDGGYRISFGMEGGITGQGADFILIDDPIKINDATNENELKRVNDIYNDTISNRLNDPKTGVRVLIMQRLNHNDLSGHVLKKGWESLILPTEYEVESRFTSSINFKDPRTEEGELLWEERFDQDYIDELKETMSSLAVAGQFQQRPSLASGFIFKKVWFTKREMNADVVARFISGDTAQSITDSAAYSSFVVGELMADHRLFIRAVYREKLEFPQLQYMIERIATEWKFNLKAIVIESKSSGSSIIQSLRQTSQPWIGQIVVPFNPTTDKIDRANKAAVWCENGCVVFPPTTEDFPWLFDFEEELFQFPQGKYKDQVDCFSQLVLYLSHYLAQGLDARRSAQREKKPDRARRIALSEF